MRRQSSPRFRIVTCWLLVGFLAPGCSGVQLSDREQAFARQFPYADVNHSLVLHTVEGITETRIDRVVTLELVNHSDQLIGFPAGYGVEGFAYDPESDRWVEIGNSVRFPDVQRVLGPRGGEIPSLVWVDYKPVLESTQDSLEIRIVVVGHFYDETTGFGEAAAAFLDLTLEE
jgi:hypothetical protein